VTVYKWKDKADETEGGLFKPVPYDRASVSLVIQNARFSETNSGRPVSFRRRSLLEHWGGSGGVCQVQDCPIIKHPKRALQRRRLRGRGERAGPSRAGGLARIGIIGFSRPAFMLEGIDTRPCPSRRLHHRWSMGDYLQYMMEWARPCCRRRRSNNRRPTVWRRLTAMADGVRHCSTCTR